MMAIIASLPLANSAESFFVFSAGSLEVKTLKPKSPAAAGGAGRLVLGNLAEGHVGEDLSPSCGRHFRDCSQSVGHIGEFQAR